MAKTLSRWLCTTALLVLAACGDSIHVTPDAPGADAAPPIDTPAGPRIKLQVKPVIPGAAIPGGRLVVAFYQQSDDITVDPRFYVGYDVAFTGQLQTIELPLDEIRLPGAIDDYRYCPRACKDLSDPACDCIAAQPKVAMAFVYVVSDLDGSGKIEPSEVEWVNRYGVGYFLLGAADRAYPTPNILDFMYPEGVVEGLAPYRVLPPLPQSSFERLGIPAPGTVFELDVCVPADASCAMLRYPNLS